MSQYEELTTTMTDQQYLVEALTEMGYKPEVQTEGTALRGYGGVSWNRPVQVTIPREQLRGALASVGFGRDDAGVFQAVIDDLDRKCSGSQSRLGRVAQPTKWQTMAVANTKAMCSGPRWFKPSQGPKAAAFRGSTKGRRTSCRKTHHRRNRRKRKQLYRPRGFHGQGCAMSP